MFGGRPMMLLERGVFTDIVSGESVNLYLDMKGRKWLATDRWGWFRVRENNLREIGSLHVVDEHNSYLNANTIVLSNLKPGDYPLYIERE